MIPADQKHVKEVLTMNSLSGMNMETALKMFEDNALYWGEGDFMPASTFENLVGPAMTMYIQALHEKGEKGLYHEVAYSRGTIGVYSLAAFLKVVRLANLIKLDPALKSHLHLVK